MAGSLRQTAPTSPLEGHAASVRPGRELGARAAEDRIEALGEVLVRREQRHRPWQRITDQKAVVVLLAALARLENLLDAFCICW